MIDTIINAVNTALYDKTAKGKKEIATRSGRLAPRLRTLLVLVDGRRTVEELLHHVAGIGLHGEALAELLEHGYIVPATGDDPAATVAVTVAGPPAPKPPTQFQAVYDFYNNTIKNTIGLRGFTLQLKVEKACNIDDLRELRQPYIEAVQKARGGEIATALARKLDELLAATPAAPAS